MARSDDRTRSCRCLWSPSLALTPQLLWGVFLRESTQLNFSTAWYKHTPEVLNSICSQEREELSDFLSKPAWCVVTWFKWKINILYLKDQCNVRSGAMIDKDLKLEFCNFGPIRKLVDEGIEIEIFVAFGPIGKLVDSSLYGSRQYHRLTQPLTCFFHGNRPQRTVGNGETRQTLDTQCARPLSHGGTCWEIKLILGSRECFIEKFAFWCDYTNVQKVMLTSQLHIVQFFYFSCFSVFCFYVITVEAHARLANETLNSMQIYCQSNVDLN